MARSRKVKERTPIKAEMGSWNFVKSGMKNGTVHWLCVCDCERSVLWKLPCRLNEESTCQLCSGDRRAQNYKAGKQVSQDSTEVKDEQIAEKVAPPGQLSLETPKKNFEQASPEVKQLCREAADILNAAYKTPVQHDPQDVESNLLLRLEYSLRVAVETAHRLKEAQIKRSMK